MNRTNNKEFFQCWDKSKQLIASRYNYLSPKEQLEYEEAVSYFFDEYGFEPTEHYTQCIQHWNEYYEA